jgi:hypothetical protein
VAKKKQIVDDQAETPAEDVPVVEVPEETPAPQTPPDQPKVAEKTIPRFF